MDTSSPFVLQVKRLGLSDGVQSCESIVASEGPTKVMLLRGMLLLQNGTGLICRSGQDSREPGSWLAALAYTDGDSQKGAK